jgi:DNA-binding NtrC family response regulator
MQAPISREIGMKPLPTILVLEDDRTSSDLLCQVLRENGLNPLAAYNAADAAAFLRSPTQLSAAMIDLSLPDGDGLDVLRDARQLHPELPCYVLTVSESVGQVVGAMKAGATDYMVKPFEPLTLLATLKQAILVYEARLPRQSPEQILALSMRSWESPKMRVAVKAALKAAASPSPVLISGMPFTGKISIARLIHEASGQTSPLRCLDAARLKPEQMATELFGLPKGLLNQIGPSSVFIQNIDALSPEIQMDLMNWLNSHGIDKSSSCRLITSTTVTRAAALSKGFHEGLWYALSVYHVKVPRLVDRPEDLLQICEDIVTRTCIAKKIRRPSFTRKAVELITDHSWPGNLSELESVMERAISNTIDGLIGPGDLPHLLPIQAEAPAGEASEVAVGATSIDEIAKVHLLAALQACGGNRRRAANRLNISTRTVYNMIRRYGIDGKKKKTKPSAPKTNP